MKTHPIEAAAICAVAVVRLIRAVAVPVVALALTVAGWRPAAVASVPAPATVAPLVAVASLPVRELRQLARIAGHRALARNGRRADLLAALALA
ncbi:hypothetical protein LBMAG41_13300 [Cyanobium sp.]|nr:hypothetical protein LBMAG41_13300 [Cyanobium sp.]